MNLINKSPRFAWEVALLHAEISTSAIADRLLEVTGDDQAPCLSQKLFVSYLQYTIIGNIHNFGILLVWQYNLAGWKLTHRICATPEHAIVGYIHKN